MIILSEDLAQTPEEETVVEQPVETTAPVEGDVPVEAPVVQSKSKEIASKIIVKIGELQSLNNKLLAAMDEDGQYKNPSFEEFNKMNYDFSISLHKADKLFTRMMMKVK